MSGNPIGREGMKAFTSIALSVRPCNHSLDITAKNCNVQICDEKCVYYSLSPAVDASSGEPAGDVGFVPYDSTAPLDQYELDLSVPFERACAVSLLELVANHKTYVIDSLCIDEHGVGKSKHAGGKGKDHKAKSSSKKGEAIELMSAWAERSQS